MANMLAMAKPYFPDFAGIEGIFMLCEQNHCCAQTKSFKWCVFQLFGPFPHPAKADTNRIWHFLSEQADTV